MSVTTMGSESANLVEDRPGSSSELDDGNDGSDSPEPPLGLGAEIDARTSPRRILQSLPTLSPGEFDTIIKETHSIGNVARLRFARQLLILRRSTLFRKLGFSSIHGYAKKRFKYSMSSTYGFLRVAGLIDDFPRLQRHFCSGDMSWRMLHEILKVASPETELLWIEFLERYGPESTIREVKYAKLHKQDRPRDEGGGLPDEPVKLILELLPEEFELIKQAMAKAGDEMRAGLTGELTRGPASEDEDGELDFRSRRVSRIELKDALLYVSRRILETESSEALFAERKESGRAYAVLHTICQACARGTLQTAEGEIEIDAERVDAIAGCAEHVVISPEEELPSGESSSGESSSGDGGAAPDAVPDATNGTTVPISERDRPNSTALSGKVVLKDGRRCANPFCDNQRGSLHAHHVVWRVNGGKSEIWNEISLCSRCHSLVHLRYLAVTGDRIYGIQFQPAGSPSTRELEADLARLSRVLEIRYVGPGVGRREPGAGEPGDGEPGDGKPGAGEPDGPTRDPHLLAALRKVGYSASEARERVESAYGIVEDQRPELLGTKEGDSALFEAAINGALR